MVSTNVLYGNAGYSKVDRAPCPSVLPLRHFAGVLAYSSQFGREIDTVDQDAQKTGRSL